MDGSVAAVHPLWLMVFGKRGRGHAGTVDPRHVAEVTRRANAGVRGSVSARERLAEALSQAYGSGLLSGDTLTRRLDALLSSQAIDPASVIGDLASRVSRDRWRDRLRREWRLRLRAPAAAGDLGEARVLALDWDGGDVDLLVGRDPQCDIVLGDMSVSRQHARLYCRDGKWVVQDLDSTNGTLIGGVAIGRSGLRPGDRLWIGEVLLWLT
jgi:hypothetical protein